MQPFDYRLAVQNPVAMALQGYQQGQQMVGQREEAAMNREIFDMKKQEFEMNRLSLEQEQATAAAMQADLAAFTESMRAGTATVDDVVSLSAKYPALGEQIQASWTLKDDANKQTTKKEIVRLGAALKFSPEVAMRIVDERIAALEENGDPEALAAVQAIKGYMEMDPQAALTSIVLQANNVMEPEEFEAFSELIMPKRPEAAGEIGGIIQNWQNGLYLDFYGTEEKAREMAEADMKAAREGRPLVSNIVGGEMSPGFKAMDQAFAPLAVEWRTGGGADALAQIVKIEDVIGRVDRGENISGGVTGFAPDLLRAIVDPNAQDAKETVEDVVQRNLRVILGAQFTAAEGERLVARAFNPRLSPEVNRKRLQRLFTQMRLAAQQKEEMVNYFTSNGSLMGFNGRQPSLNDFYDAIEGVSTEDQTADQAAIDQILSQLPE